MHFLDIEAEVDRDEDDEDEDEGIADFMVDEDDAAYGSRFSHQALNSQLQNCREMYSRTELTESTIEYLDQIVQIVQMLTKRTTLLPFLFCTFYVMYPRKS
ncbi:hypothetical protein PM082_018174 [Marasmius tenuissimus]|nr:hypothetical protein PM082_018174 [Marasmius tenuissimus]